MLAYISGQPDRKDPYISLLPTGLCYLHAALLEAGYDAVLANFSGMSPRVIRHQLRQHAPSVIGISQWTHNRHDALKLATLVKECLPGCAVIMGGSHATYCYEAILQRHADVDVVVLGEGSVHCCSWLDVFSTVPVMLISAALPFVKMDKWWLRSRPD